MLIDNYTSSTASVSGQLENVTCSTSVDCLGDSLGVMSARECCVDYPLGLAYRGLSAETCVKCVGKILFYPITACMAYIDI